MKSIFLKIVIQLIIFNVNEIETSIDVDLYTSPFNDLINLPLRFKKSYDKICDVTVCNSESIYDVSNDQIVENCTVIYGDLKISKQIRYVPECLEELYGDLIMEKNTIATSFYGFGNLKRLHGNLRIQGNQRLTSLHGLNSLQFVEGSVYITHNNIRMSYSSLDKTVLEQLRVEGDIIGNSLLNEYIVSAVNDPNGTNFYDPIVSHNLKQTDFKYSEEDGNALDDPVYPIPESEFHFPRVVRSLTDEDSELSTTLFTSDQLVSLIDLSGLEAVQHINGSLYITDNKELLRLNGLNSLVSISGSYVIERNLKLQTTNGTNSLLTIGDEYYVDQVSVANKNGDLRINYNNNLLSFEGIKNLINIKGNLNIVRNSKLQSICGMDNLISIGNSFIVHHNVNLLKICNDPLSLQIIYGDFKVYDNRRLNSLQGLENLIVVHQSFSMYHHPLLVDITGQLSNLSQIGRDFFLNGQMPNYNGLSNLNAVNGSLLIYNMPMLETLDGFQQLTTVGNSLNIYMNPKLWSIDELANLKYVKHEISILNNEMLERVDMMLNSLHYVLDYVQISFANGTIDCPQGSGIQANQTDVLGEKSVVEATTFGNWCTLNCAFPKVTASNVVLGEPKRSWECMEDSFYPVDAPKCL